MSKFYKLFFIGLFFSVFYQKGISQNLFFNDLGANKVLPNIGQRVIIPQQFKTVSLNFNSMKVFLRSLPSESQNLYRNQAPVLTLIKPDGSPARFHVWESSIQEPALQVKFPDIRTFAGQGIDDPYASIRFDIGPNGFHAQILSANGSYYIDPFSVGDVNNYISYYRKDLIKSREMQCEVPDEPMRFAPSNTAAACLGTQLRTYRLAVACTGEYAQAPGIAAGSDPNILHNAIVTSVNRVDGVYEQEVAVRLVLVANNNLVEFLNAGSDPFNGNNNAGLLINESQTVINANIGAANYDIGHTFSTGGGGLAQLQCVCGPSKARGITGSPNPTGDAYNIDYVAHEMGHQFGGNHTFNSTTSSCGGGNRNASTAYEVGSGTTIQAYAGICASDNIQPNSDPFFHAISFDEISNFVVSGGGAACAVLTATGNTLPVIDPLPNNNLTIPVSTPFTLSGTATDANGDPLTYCWEEMDLGPGGAWNSGASSTTAPLFKSRVPKTNGSRTFPDMAVILAGYPANPAATMGGLKGETLPTVARNMKFRFTVRDNRAGGGGVVSSGDGGCQSSTSFVVTTSGSTPFTVTTPNGGESYSGGSTQTITWNNAGTNAVPFNVANVKISLSTDGGLTYPTVITNSTANDGSEALTIPSVPATTTARIKIEAVGSIFFDISNANFSITVPVNGYAFGTATTGSISCASAGPINSTLPVNLLGSYTGPVSLTYVSGAPGGTNVTISPNSFTATGNATVSLNNTGALTPGTYTVVVQGSGPAPGGTQTANVSFTVNAGAGPSISVHPASQTTCVGTGVNFSVTASGALSYQWEYSTNGGTTWSIIAGAISSSYNFPSPTVTHNNWQFRCVVTGQCGVSNSNAAVLTVNTAPAVTGQPANLAVCSGSAASFTVTATGSSIGYQWELSTDGGTTWNPIGGATSATYSIASTLIGQNGHRFRCVVTGVCPPAATSSSATLTVNSSVTVTTNPSNQTICEGTGTSFSAAASGSGLNYQWEVSTDGGVTWNNVSNGANYSGASTTTLTLINTPPTFNQNRYRCNISSPPCTPGITASALLTVNSYPVITAQPVSQTFCEGSNVTLSVSATTSVGALTYQWQASTNGGATWFNLVFPTSSLTPTNNSTLVQTNVPAIQNGYRYRCAVTAGCGTTFTNAAIFTVNTYPVISLNALPKTVCVSDAAFNLSASYSGGVWSGTGVTSGGLFTPSTAGIGNHTVTYTATNAGCTKAASSLVFVQECADRHRKLNEKHAVLIMPNPNKGNFSLKMNTDLYTSLGVKVYGADGRLYRTYSYAGLTYGSVIPMDLTSLAQGTYYLYMYNSENGFISRGDGVIIVH